MEMGINLDTKKLKNIAESSHTAKVLLAGFANRERDRSQTDISRVKHELLKRGEKIKQEDFIQAWKDLEKSGVGIIVGGKNGKPMRFIWNYSLKNVGSAAIEGKDINPSELLTVKLVDRIKKNKEHKKEPIKTLYIPLREGFAIRIELPEDLSQKETNIIIDAIKSI